MLIISYISKLLINKITMSSKKRPYYVQKINLSNDNIRKTRRNHHPKLCPDCKEANGCIKLFSNDVNRIEDTINTFYKNFPKKKERPSTFNLKFSLNNVPCELEYDLSKFTFENLQKLVIFTTQNCNNSSDENDRK